MSGNQEPNYKNQIIEPIKFQSLNLKA